MPFGAYETMEVHAILDEKINQINHYGMYAQQAQNQALRQMINNHLQAAIQSYNQLVGYTHDYTQVQSSNKMQHIMSVQPQQITYGLHHPAPQTPQAGVNKFNDQQIAAALMAFHKNSATSHMSKSLECADPNVRQMLVNDAVYCGDLAYEVFLYMNNQGQYQIPTMQDHTAKTYLHTFQPMGQAGMTMNQNTAQSQGDWQYQNPYQGQQQQ